MDFHQVYMDVKQCGSGSVGVCLQQLTVTTADEDAAVPFCRTPLTSC